MYDIYCCFFFNDTATTEIYTLSLHDALPISDGDPADRRHQAWGADPRPDPDDLRARRVRLRGATGGRKRSEEHTSELQSRQYLVCRLLLEKKKIKQKYYQQTPLPLVLRDTCS